MIDCKTFAKIRLEACKKLVGCDKKAPNLLIVNDNSSDASAVYVRNKVKACKEVGINVTVQNEMPLELDKYDSVIVQLPNNNADIERISVGQDVDCLTEKSVGKLHMNKAIFEPCTPKGIIDWLKYNHVVLEGANVCVIGRSDIVGRPIVSMFEHENSTVTLCHSHTKNLADITSQADILIVAIGKAKFINKDYVKDGAIVIDVGINRDKNNKLCGDVDYDDVLSKASYITPVPGGVGKLTVSTLIQNVVMSNK